MAALTNDDGLLHCTPDLQDKRTSFHAHLSGLVKEYEVIFAELQSVRIGQKKEGEIQPKPPSCAESVSRKPSRGQSKKLSSGCIRNVKPPPLPEGEEPQAQQALKSATKVSFAESHVMEVEEHSEGSEGSEASNEDGGIQKANSWSWSSAQVCTELSNRERRSSGESLFSKTDLKLRSAWNFKDNSPTASASHSRKSAFHVPGTFTISSFSLENNNILAHDGFLRHFISFPGSPCRLTWDMAGAMLLLVDIIMIPLRAFSPPENTFTRILDWFILSYWTCDVLASFLVGYVKDGLTIMQPGMIAQHYAKTWLVIDLAILLPDWTMSLLSVGEDNQAGGSTQVLRIMRGMRVMRLVRVFKLKTIIERVGDMINSEYINIVAYIFRMILLLLVINHIIACIWFHIATLQGQRGFENWVSFHKFENDEWYYQYATAFHWSITQFTPASMHVQPQNMFERVYCLLVVVLALVIFSYLVGSITSALAQIRTMHEEKDKQFSKVRRYLSQNSVPVSLSVRIKRYLEHAWQTQHGAISVHSIKVLGMLSEQLHHELRSSIISPHLSVHPMMKALGQDCPRTMQRVIDGAVTEKHFASDDAVFLEGESSQNAYFPITGRFIYIYTENGTVSNTPSGKESKVQVDPGKHWISEPALWVENWHHLGMLVAASDGHLILVNGERFAEAIRKGLAITFSNISGFALDYWLTLRDGDPPYGGELSCADHEGTRPSWWPTMTNAASYARA